MSTEPSPSRESQCLTAVSSTSRCPTWRSTVSGSATCWTQSLRGLWGFVSTPSWVPMWRTCPNWLWLVSQTSGTWWTLATKLGQCVLVLQYYIISCELFNLFTADAMVQNVGGWKWCLQQEQSNNVVFSWLKSEASKNWLPQVVHQMKMITSCV